MFPGKRKGQITCAENKTRDLLYGTDAANVINDFFADITNPPTTDCNGGQYRLPDSITRNCDPNFDWRINITEEIILRKLAEIDRVSHLVLWRPMLWYSISV